MSELENGGSWCSLRFRYRRRLLSACTTLALYQVSLVQRQLRRDCREFVIGLSPRSDGDLGFRLSGYFLIFPFVRAGSFLYFYGSFPQIAEKENCNPGIRVAIVLPLNRFAKKF